MATATMTIMNVILKYRGIGRLVGCKGREEECWREDVEGLAIKDSVALALLS